MSEQNNVSVNLVKNAEGASTTGAGCCGTTVASESACCSTTPAKGQTSSCCG